MRQQWQTSSPGKYILFGEFAVLWGYEAIAAPLKARLRISWAQQKNAGVFGVQIGNTTYSWAQIKERAEQIAYRYQLFQQKNITIEQVLQHPKDLMLAALSQAPLDYQTSFMQLDIHSQIDIGAGQGSSAALITAILKSWEQPENLCARATAIEHYQHGYSSGLDVAVAAYEQPIAYRSAQALNIVSFPSQPSLVIVHTGQPKSTTGQSVAQAQSLMRPVLLSDYPHDLIKKALSTFAFSDWCDAIKANHRWLCALGVVPASVQSFIAEIEALGSAAKISGAGAICGHNAGLVVALSHPGIPKLAHEYGYCIKEIVDVF